MDYKGMYSIFDPSAIKTYPISNRTNKVKIKDLVQPGEALKESYVMGDELAGTIDTIAKKIVQSRAMGKPVVFFSGAHLVKNGLGLLVRDLIEKDFITLFAGNGATSIHDFELALIGETSEYVPEALQKGQFGMAYEFCYQNEAVKIGDKYKLGYGESLGKMIYDESFRAETLQSIGKKQSGTGFEFPEVSILAKCFEKKVPFTVHVGIGTDVIDQHKGFDGGAKGAASGRDFLIYVKEITKLTEGGVVLNIGSAVTGPEVFLKAVSMASNAGLQPSGIMTADFDIREHKPEEMVDEGSQCYYFRDQKSIVTRIPGAFEGEGFYVWGNQKVTLPALYKRIIELSGRYE